MPDAADLLPHDPNLALILANHRHRWPALASANWPEIQARLRGKRTELLGWIGLPAREGMRKLLRKLSSWDLAFLPAAAEALARPDLLQTLQNLPSIEYGTIELLGCARLRPAVSPALLQSISRHSESWWNLVDLLPKLTVLFDHGVVDLKHPQVLSALMQGGVTLRMMRSGAIVDQPFPAAPFLTDADLEPIESIHALIKEGREMNHCVGALDNLADAVSGMSYFYRVLSPVRATLQLSWQYGAWWFVELRGADNQPLTRRESQTALRSFPASSRIIGLSDQNYA